MNSRSFNPNNLRRYKDTSYYLTADAKVYHLLENGTYKQLKGVYDKRSRRIRIHIEGKRYSLSRLMWETFKGEIPEGYMVGHRNGCSTINEIGNLWLVKRNELSKYKPLNRNTKKVINLDTHEISKGLHSASRKYKSTRSTIRAICSGAKMKTVKYKLAWWDDVNGKAFIGDYEKYYNKYMKEELEW